MAGWGEIMSILFFFSFQAMMGNNVVKVHIELHNEIKKNGSVRSLRAALSRFGKLAHMIR